MGSPIYSLVQRVSALIRKLQTLACYFCALLFAILFVSFVLQIGMRFLLNNPLNWSEELAVICYIWIVFVACALILRDDQHIVFTLITQFLPQKGQLFCQLITSILFGGILIAISLGVFDYVAFMKVETTSALTLRKDYIYAVFDVFIVVLILRCFWSAFLAFCGLFMQKTYQSLIMATAAPEGEQQ